MLLSIRERKKGEGRSGTEPNSLGDAQRTRLDAVTFVLFSSTVRLASPPQFASRLAEQVKENGLTRGDVEKNASGQQSLPGPIAEPKRPYPNHQHWITKT